jgi:hypothetical protein
MLTKEISNQEADGGAQAKRRAMDLELEANISKCNTSSTRNWTAGSVVSLRYSEIFIHRTDVTLASQGLER